MLIAKDSDGKNFAKAGTHIARCVQVIDIGTQYSDYYENSKHKVVIGWELPEEIDPNDESPTLVWKRYTVSLDQRARLRQDLESWRGRAFTREELKGFNLALILDKPCMINIVHAEREHSTYANVNGVMALPQSQKYNVPKRFHPLIKFDLSEPDKDVFDTFGDNLKATIASSPEAKAKGITANGEQVRTEANDKPCDQHETISEDDIPF